MYDTFERRPSRRLLPTPTWAHPSSFNSKRHGHTFFQFRCVVTTKVETAGSFPLPRQGQGRLSKPIICFTPRLLRKGDQVVLLNEVKTYRLSIKMNMTPRRTRSGRVFNNAEVVDPPALGEEPPPAFVPTTVPTIPSPRIAPRPLANPRRDDVAVAAVAVAAATGATTNAATDSERQENNDDDNNNRGSPRRIIGSYFVWPVNTDIVQDFEHNNLFAISLQHYGPENPARVFVLDDTAFNNLQVASTVTDVRFQGNTSFPEYPYVTFHGSVLSNVTNNQHPPRTPTRQNAVYVKCPSAEESMHDSVSIPRDTTDGTTTTTTTTTSATIPTCIICYENRPICMAFPCNHLSYCVACARTLSLTTEGLPKRYGQVPCPKCRALVISFERCVFEL